MGSDQRVSSYAEHLPAVLRQGPFLERFLLAFEAILSGGVAAPELEPQRMPDGLEALIGSIHTYFDPSVTPEEFLPWLAQWVATSLRDDWDEATRRAFIGQIVPLYRERGTRAGMEKVLKLYADDVEIIDLGDKMPDHYFQVLLTVSERNPALLARRTRLARAIIDREKPAHTYYGLVIQYPAMRINNTPNAKPIEYGPGIVLGQGSLLGTSMKISNDPKAKAEDYGPGIIVGENTVLGTMKADASGGAPAPTP